MEVESKQPDNQTNAEVEPVDYLTNSELDRLNSLLGLTDEQRAEIQRTLGNQATNQSSGVSNDLTLGNRAISQISQISQQTISDTDDQSKNQSVDQTNKLSNSEPVALTTTMIDLRIFQAHNVDENNGTPDTSVMDIQSTIFTFHSSTQALTCVLSMVVILMFT